MRKIIAKFPNFCVSKIALIAMVSSCFLLGGSHSFADKQCSDPVNILTDSKTVISNKELKIWGKKIADFVKGYTFEQSGGGDFFDKGYKRKVLIPKIISLTRKNTREDILLALEKIDELEEFFELETNHRMKRVDKFIKEYTQDPTKEQTFDEISRNFANMIFDSECLSDRIKRLLSFKKGKIELYKSLEKK